MSGKTWQLISTHEVFEIPAQTVALELFDNLICKALGFATQGTGDVRC